MQAPTCTAKAGRTRHERKSAHMNTPAERETILQDAATWKIRLHENPDDPGLKAQLAAWRALDARHDRAWRRMERVWGATAELGEQAAMLSQAGPPGRAVRARRLRVGACVGATALACVLALVPSDFLLRLRADYATTTAQTRTVVLPDGSSVVLGARSAIAVRYSATERGVTLLEGQAFFRVAHDLARGFTVVAGDVTTRDIGTAFDIQMAGPHVAVAVREGGVNVSRRGDGSPVRLIAGQQWAFDRQTGKFGIGAVDPDTVGAWRSGHLVLDGLTLLEAMDVLGRYYPGTVVTRGLARDTTLVGGVYDLRRPREALQALCALHGGRLVSLPAGFVLALPGPEKP